MTHTRSGVNNAGGIGMVNALLWAAVVDAEYGVMERCLSTLATNCLQRDPPARPRWWKLWLRRTWAMSIRGP